MIKCIIFDWGGVIAKNPQGGWLDVLSNILNTTVQDLLPHWKQAGYSELSKGSITVEEFWNRFTSSYKKTLPSNKDDIWIIGSALTPDEGMTAFVNNLKLKDYSVSILSNTVKPMSRQARDLKLYSLFDPVILSDEVGLVKPDKAIYKLIPDELNIGPKECLFVDDQEANLVPASELGMQTVLASKDFSITISAIKEKLSL